MRHKIRVALMAAAVAVLAVINLQLLLITDWTMLRGGIGADWAIFVEAGRRVEEGQLYAVEAEYAFRYSPVLAHVFGVVSAIGPLAWRIGHVLAAASLLLIDPRMAVVTLIAWPFWFDVEAGNMVTFVFVLAAWALTGRRWAVGAYLALAILAPRPLALPVAAWLLWNQPDWRLPFAAVFAVHAVLVAVTGWGPEWVAALIGSSAEIESVLNFGPSRWIGWVWVPMGAVLAILLTVRGHLGWASLAASPYWLPYYLLMPLLEMMRLPGRRAEAVEGAARHRLARGRQE